MISNHIQSIFSHATNLWSFTRSWCLIFAKIFERSCDSIFGNFPPFFRSIAKAGSIPKPPYGALECALQGDIFFLKRDVTSLSTLSHRIHGKTHIYLHWSHKNQLNVGKYTIHGWYEYVNPPTLTAGTWNFDIFRKECDRPFLENYLYVSFQQGALGRTHILFVWFMFFGFQMEPHWNLIEILPNHKGNLKKWAVSWFGLVVRWLPKSLEPFPDRGDMRNTHSWGYPQILW